MKILKGVAIALLTVVALAVGGLVIKFYVLSPKMRPPVEVKAPSTPEAIARGSYLANHVMVCMGCHSPTDLEKPGQPLIAAKIGSGREFEAPPGLAAQIRAPNLTPDPDTGIGRLTDGQLLRAMREGIGHDGHALFPMMPYQVFAANMSDDDALSVIAYLRSLNPVHNELGLTKIPFPVSMFIRGVPKPVEHPSAGAPTEPLARGKWLLEVCSCTGCHTTYDDHHDPIPGRYLAGGNAITIPGKGKVYTKNLTSDRATGLGGYTDEEIMRAITSGLGKAGRMLYDMPWPYYGGMTEDDKKALILALRQVPPVVNQVPADDMKD